MYWFDRLWFFQAALPVSLFIFYRAVVCLYTFVVCKYWPREQHPNVMKATVLTSCLPNDVHENSGTGKASFYIDKCLFLYCMSYEWINFDTCAFTWFCRALSSPGILRVPAWSFNNSLQRVSGSGHGSAIQNVFYIRALHFRQRMFVRNCLQDKKNEITRTEKNATRTSSVITRSY